MQWLQEFIGKHLWETMTVTVTVLFFFYWCYLPSILLVWRCLSIDERFPLLNTMRAVWDSLWPFKPAIFRKQMRLWLELRLLHPKPGKEPGWYLDSKTKRYQLEFDDREYRKALSDWKRDIYGKFGALKLKEQEPIIEVKDVFQLNDEVTKNGIKIYLLAVAELKLSLDEEASFLCKVKINEGFLLPLNLLAGLMSRFSEDWDPIISSYGQMAARSFSAVQISIFDLWLLWGPSIPICGCDQWSGPVTLQYGFGDENNSVRVRVDDKMKKRLLTEFRESVEARTTTAYPALHASITGKLWPPSSFVQGEFCGAQSELQNPDREAFILEYDSHTVTGNPSGSHLFYTAYVWALFVVGRERKPSADTVRKEPWLHVVPFFEHANIVDEATYEAAKRQLAQKVLTFARDSARSESDPTLSPPRLWYVCALDDSGCGQNVAVIPKGRSIRVVLEELLDEHEHNRLKQRVTTNDTSFADLLSGCHLSEAVTEFFEAIEKQQHKRGMESKSEKG